MAWRWSSKITLSARSAGTSMTCRVVDHPVRRGQGSGRAGTSTVSVSSALNRNRWLSGTTAPLGERSVKLYPGWASRVEHPDPVAPVGPQHAPRAQVAEVLDGSVDEPPRVEGQVDADQLLARDQPVAVVRRLHDPRRHDRGGPLGRGEARVQVPAQELADGRQVAALDREQPTGFSDTLSR